MPQQETFWFVYLLECADKSLYCGICRNVEKRLAQHNGKLAGGARYTRGRRPARLLSALHCQDKSSALKLEAAIKRLPRKNKLRFFQMED